MRWKRWLGGLLLVVTTLAAAAAWLWYAAPEHLPAALRARNPHSVDYAPVLYRWKDDLGRTQVTDRPPEDGRPYETVVIDPQTNIVPRL
ncbi:MAG: hypothetical protein KatS3mg126_0898 [Lysobacteraceae bacterium]|nr:MAG: hypothetical protein KatS3mg126_0898 [Xanthomonadaceae bacterium]